MKKLGVLFGLMALATQLVAQTPAILRQLNGKEYKIQLLSIDYQLFSTNSPKFTFKMYRTNGKSLVIKPKVYSSSGEKTFSIIDSTGRELKVFKPDTDNGDMTFDQTSNFVYGMSDGRRYRTGGDFLIGTGCGLAGSLWGVVYGWSVPFVGAGLNAGRPIKPRPIVLKHPTLTGDVYYTAGLKRKIRLKRFGAGLLGGLTGMAIGTVMFQFGIPFKSLQLTQ